MCGTDFERLVQLARSHGMTTEDSVKWAEGVQADDRKIIEQFDVSEVNGKYVPLRDYIEELDRRINANSDS